VDRDQATRRLLTCGVAGPVLFMVAFLVDGAVRPGHDPATTPVSQLLLGDQGWLEIVNFIVSGLLISTFAVGLRRVLTTGTGSRWGPIMVGAAGIGLMMAGVFMPDPAFGYPPGTPPGATQSYSGHATVHLLAALLVFGGLPIACVILARRFRATRSAAWSGYSLVSGLGMLLLFVFYAAGAGGAGGLEAVAGWLERASIMIGFAWVALLAIHFLHSPVPAPRDVAEQTFGRADRSP
jgi:hypothetical membrane protein